MGKALGAMVAVFAAGGLSMNILSDALGGFAECAALGVVGAGLLLSSHRLGTKLSNEGAVTPVAREVSA